MKLQKKLAAVLSAALAMGTIISGTSIMSLAEESTWPADENITMIIPAKAGGVNDTIARLMQEYFQNKLDAVVVVTNYDTKAVAYDAVHSAKNDGYTLMLQHSTLFAEAAGGNVAFNPVEELDVVGEICTLGESAYIAPADAPYNTFSELVEYAKENPGKVNAAYSAKGMSHFQWGAIEQAAGIDLALVDASSESEKLTNVAGGFIGLAGVTLASAKEYADAGELKILSVSNASEFAEENGYEQMEELGYTTMAVNYMYVWAPDGVDEATAQRINEVLCEMTEDAEFQEKMSTAGYPVITTDRETAAANAEAEMESAYELAEVLGLSE